MSVIASTDQQVPELLQSNPLTIIKFYADWCGSCKLFAPKYKRLASDERFQGITFLDVNAETNPESRKLAQVNNLPAFAIFKNGALLETINASKEEAVVELLEKLKN